jgi:hypothetical protein
MVEISTWRFVYVICTQNDQNVASNIQEIENFIEVSEAVITQLS